MSTWTHRDELAHSQAVVAATAGMSDPALGGLRVAGAGVTVLAEAAVSSATPFLRAPLLARIADTLALHTPSDGPACPTCAVPAPCPTTLALWHGR
jgi:hypothetical protein